MGYNFNAQDFREALLSGKIILPDKNFTTLEEIKESDLEKRIQPASFEPTLDGTGFILDTEINGIFRVSENKSVYKTILELPKRQRREINLEKDFLLTRYTYLLKLQEKINLEDDERLKSSPKSTSGRDFLNTRLLADYNSGYDEVLGGKKRVQDLWLLLQPLAFNVLAAQGLTLNQLRIFKGLDAKLSEEEIEKYHANSPLLLEEREESLFPSSIKNGELLIHLNLKGKKTSGIVGLVARKNPDPIHLTKTNNALAEDYFEPVIPKHGKITLIPGKYYLLGSKEVLHIPADLSTEVRATHHTGIQGLLHFAGFIDPGFKGDLVFEVRSDEKTPVEVEDGTPISVLDVYKSREAADKIYGKEIGSNYQAQQGPKTSKHFTPFNFKRAAKEYDKLDKIVLVEEKNKLLSLRKNVEGFERVDETERITREIITNCENGFFLSRYDCEDDELVLQPIPYVLVFGEDEDVFTYLRAKDLKDYGDARLFDKYSIGVGGHIVKNDGPDYIKTCLERELSEEIRFDGWHTQPRLVGTLYSVELPVDRVHFGLIYAMSSDGNVLPNESSLAQGGMKKIQELLENTELTSKSETWTKLLIPYLRDIKKMLV